MVEELARCGVRRAALSPGSRSTPLAVALSREPAIEVTVILDERGENVTSASFAGHLQGWRTQGRPAAVFVIGGADGLAPSLRERADLAIAFGTATWPHQLVRIMLLEQLYRAVTMLSGHPYHLG